MFRSPAYSLIVIPAKASDPASLAHTHVMAGLDPAISGQRQIRGSSPRMTYYKSVMAGLDPAISGQRQIRGSSPRMTGLEWEKENFPLDSIPSIG
jgi:hypothetical protein